MHKYKKKYIIKKKTKEKKKRKPVLWILQSHGVNQTNGGKQQKNHREDICKEKNKRMEGVEQ